MYEGFWQSEYSYGAAGTDRRYIDKRMGWSGGGLLLRISMPDDV